MLRVDATFTRWVPYVDNDGSKRHILRKGTVTITVYELRKLIAALPPTQAANLRRELEV